MGSRCFSPAPVGLVYKFFQLNLNEMDITISKNNTDEGIIKLARFGMYAKGAVYCIWAF